MEWGSGGQSEDKAFIVISLKGSGEAEWAASGLASLVSFSRLWGTVTVLVVPVTWGTGTWPWLPEGQVESGLEGESSTKEKVGVRALD